ncbi:MAG: Tm-1-like ATP-binding domain-containing protein [Oscillospiraceae bacterium]|nr:Tm-1-like ATP-binding domain-containing protein [Oscillospiraceae bacterium]
MATIAVIATLDTKGPEAAYLKECIEGMNHHALLLDTGMLFEPGAVPDITRTEILAAGGVHDKDAVSSGGKQLLVKAMTAGLVKVLGELCDSGKIQGVLSIGGAQGTAMSTAAMRELPIGFPKVMISTIACGSAKFGDYVGNRDITMIPSLCDVCGINAVTGPIFKSGCGAVIGMIEIAEKQKNLPSGKPVVALTMAGVTTKSVMRVKELLEDEGYETIVCHCNGVGAIIIDELAKQNKLAAVLDITRHDVGGYLFDGLMKCEPNRFENVYKSGIPVIDFPGAMDFVLVGPPPITREDLKGQPFMIHTSFHTHVRAGYDKMYTCGEHDARELKSCKGRCAIMIPLRGYSQQNEEGKPLYDEQANRGYVDGVKENLGGAVEYIERDMHINDPRFADEIVKELNKLMEGRR